MVNSRHFQRLEELYTSGSSPYRTGTEVTVSLGRAEMEAEIDADTLGPQNLANHTHYRELLGDAAALAAGSLVEDRIVTSEQFNMRVEKAGYRGPVTVSARVMLAQPPRYHVEARLLDNEENTLAVGTGAFTPSSVELPSGDEVEASEAEAKARPEPAVYASVWPTPFGLIHLN